MIKPNKHLLSRLELKIISWTLAKRYQIIGFLVTFLAILLSKSLPYLNLYVTRDLTLFLVAASFLIIFNVGIRKTILLTTILFAIALGTLLFGETETAELFGNYIYGFLLTGVVSYLLRAKLK